jgi:hypothetical protein
MEATLRREEKEGEAVQEDPWLTRRSPAVAV